MKGEAAWVAEQVELFDKFCEQAGDLMWRRSAGEYNNWALDIPALMNTITTRIGTHMNDRAQHVGERQMTMMPELMSTLRPEELHAELDQETHELFERSYKRRLSRTHVEGAPASLDPFRPLRDGRDVAQESIRAEVSGDLQTPVAPEQNTPDDPDMMV
jgi:hypothetical protein